jgi:TIR domain
MQDYDAFISFASEDSNFVTEVVVGLKRNGIKVWFAPITLSIGDNLLDSIEKGLNSSKYGILVISPRYLEKGWTNYEMDILLRQVIEQRKKILPIWFKATKEQVEARHSGLAGIVAITDISDISAVISKLVVSMTEAAPSRGVIPIWESADYRFLQGLGEINLNSADGPTTTIFELLLYTKDNRFPFWLAGRLYTKQELLLEVAQLLGPVPDRVKNWVGEDGYHKLWQMCLENKINPNDFY